MDVLVDVLVEVVVDVLVDVLVLVLVEVLVEVLVLVEVEVLVEVLVLVLVVVVVVGLSLAHAQPAKMRLRLHVLSVWVLSHCSPRSTWKELLPLKPSFTVRGSTKVAVLSQVWDFLNVTTYSSSFELSFFCLAQDSTMGAVP